MRGLVGWQDDPVTSIRLAIADDHPAIGLAVRAALAADTAEPPSELVAPGQGLAEYALILALIAIVAIVVLIFLGSQISKIISMIGVSV